MRKLVIIVTACLLVGVSAFAQTKTVTGKVIGGDDKQGIPGATVLVKETKKGEAADNDGNFSIQVTKGQTLVFSAIGYAEQAIVVGDDNQINVTLKTDAVVLSESVVVGYGTQKRENLTGAVATIDVNKTLDSRPIADVGRGLQGVSPGLSVSLPSGEVGSDPRIRIRGYVGSVNGGSSPLILLDNVEIPSIQLINPDDIESISILKDAASASIYGSKASFGVILITSKKGSKTDKVTVNYNNNFSWQNVAYDIDMAGVDALKYTVDLMDRTNATIMGAFWLIDKDSYKAALKWQEKYGKTIKANDEMVYGRDWYVKPGTTSKMGVRTYQPYDYMIKEWAPSQTHNLSVVGKAGNTTYNLGLGYLKESGMMKPAKHDSFERYNTSLNLSTEVNKWFTAKANFIYSKREKKYPYATSSTTADPWYYLYRWGPLQPLTTENGQPLRSPVSEYAQANTASIYNGYTSVNLGGLFTFTPNWTLNADFTFAANDYIWLRPGTRFTYLDSWSAGNPTLDESGNPVMATDEWGIYGTPGGSIPSYNLVSMTTARGTSTIDHIYRRSAKSERTTSNVYSTYNLNLTENHTLKFMLGMNRVTYKNEYNWSQRSELNDIYDPQFDKASGTQTVGGGYDWDAQLGYFGRINYAFMDKYLVEANIRYDGSSNFPKDLKWRWFPSFSAGWVITNESFMEVAKPVLSFAKMRISYGTIGDRSTSNTLYVPTMSFATSTWLDGTGRFYYYGTPGAVRDDIRWQDIETLDFGFDLRFFKNKLGISFDWYKRTTKDMITGGQPVPTALGVGSAVGNFGELTTRGWEIAIDFNHRFKNGIGVNATVSLSDSKTKITKYVAGSTKNVANTWWEGNYYGNIYGYTTEGLYQWSDFELIDPSKGYRWDNLKMITLGGTDDPNAGRDYGHSAGKKVYMLKNHATAVYQGGLQSGTFYFGPGDVKYRDLDGDGDIYYGTGYLPIDASDKTNNIGDLSVIGNNTPRMEYGIRLGADWKGFDFSIFIQGIGKRKIVNYAGGLVVYGWNVGDGAMPQAIAGNYWTWDETTQSGNTNAFYPRPWNAGTTNTSFTVGTNLSTQSRYILNMAYTRIKNITVGYTLPNELTRKVLLNKARVYLSLENFFTFDNLNGIPIDPEAISGYSDIFDPTNGNYNTSRTGQGTPTFKSLSFGIQLTF
ncbi:MAG: SusC/RagA family TonB-linked outer membrane protein [Prevotellaceae bacterium]|nr:SusC/RagA family TonB-linked outer membrane protein [Prevotellaceae bacterium]